MSDNQYFIQKLNKLPDVQAKENDGKIAVFVMKAVSKTLSQIHGILNDEFVWEIRDAAVKDVPMQILYGICSNPVKSNKGVKAASPAPDIEIELL